MTQTRRFHLDLDLTLRASVTGDELPHFQNIEMDVAEFVTRHLNKMMGETGATVVRAGEPPIEIEPLYDLVAREAEEIEG